MGRNYELHKTHYEYEKDATRFIDECQITQKLAKVRQMIADKFDDDMGDLEQATEQTKYWKGNFGRFVCDLN